MILRMPVKSRFHSSLLCLFLCSQVFDQSTSVSNQSKSIPNSSITTKSAKNQSELSFLPKWMVWSRFHDGNQSEKEDSLVGWRQIMEPSWPKTVLVNKHARPKPIFTKMTPTTSKPSLGLDLKRPATSVSSRKPHPFKWNPTHDLWAMKTSIFPCLSHLMLQQLK